MKKIKRSNLIGPFITLSIVLITMFFSNCTKMDDTYHDFWKDGEITYPAAPDSLSTFSGKNRIEIFWLIIGDRTITKAMIYWNNKSDSLEVPVSHSGNQGTDTIDIIMDNMAEGNYSFDVYTFDQDGNRSVVSNAVGKVYGDSYSNSLLTRIVNGASLIDDTLHIQWGDPADITSIGAEIVYTDSTGNEVHRMVNPNADTTIITDYSSVASHYFKYRTLFLPDSTAIDTFYTQYDSVRVLGPRTNLSKSGWSVNVSSYDSRNGRTDRLPEKLIDENTTTAWVNLVGSSDFPHTAIIDMGSIVTGIYGVSLYTGGSPENPNSMSVYTSDDNVNWQPFGLKSIEKASGWQYFDFSEPQDFRYLKLVFEESYGSDNIILYEAGVYVR